MPKRYHLVLTEMDQKGQVKNVVAEINDLGYYVSHIMKSLAKKIYEPQPVVKLEGQEAMDL